MQCKRCQGEVSPYARKCPHCGQILGEDQGSLEKYDSLYIGTKEGEIQEDTAEANLISEGEKKINENHRLWIWEKKNQYISIVLIIAIIASVFGVKWYCSKKVYLGINGVVYVSEGEVHLYDVDSQVNETLGTIDLDVQDIGYDNIYQSEMINTVQYTKDQKYQVYMIQNKQTEELQRRQLVCKGNYKDAKPVVITESVGQYVITSDNTVIYVDENDKKIYEYDFTTRKQMVEYATAFRMSEDEKYFWYFTSEYGGQLYIQDRKGERDPYCIESDGAYFMASSDFNIIVYQSEDKLFLVEEFGDAKLIASNVGDYSCDFSDEQVVIYYIEEQQEGLTAYDFIEDVFLEQDTFVTKPDASKYKGGVSSKEYKEDLQKYEEKAARDVIRNALKLDMVGEMPRKVYRIKDGKTEVINEHGISFQYMEQIGNKIPIRFMAAEANVSGSVKFSGNELYGQLREKVQSYYTETYVNNIWNIMMQGGNAQKLGRTKYSNLIICEKRQEIYFVDNEQVEGRSCYVLKSVDYSKDSNYEIRTHVTKEQPFRIDSIFENFLILYTADETKSVIELQCSSGTSVEFQGQELIMAQSEDGKAMFCLETMYEQKKLYCIDDMGECSYITDDVVAFSAITKEKIYVLKNYEEMKKTGELYLYEEGKEPSLLAKEVQMLKNDMYCVEAYDYTDLLEGWNVNWQ